MDTNKRSLDEISDNDTTNTKRSPETVFTHIKPHFLASSSAMKIKTETSEEDDIQVLEEESVYKKSIAHTEFLDELAQSKPFHCTECDYKCSSRDKLKRHFMIHTGEKPYECTYCDYKCARSDKLKRHMMVHTGEKPYECPECDFRTARNDKLKTHIYKHILGKIPRKTNLSQSSMHKVSHSSLNSIHSTKSILSETESDTADSPLKRSTKTNDTNVTITPTKDTKTLNNSTENSPGKKSNHMDKINALDKTPNELESLKSNMDSPNSSITREHVSSSNLPKDSTTHIGNAINMYTGRSSQGAESHITGSSSQGAETHTNPPEYFYHGSLPPKDKIHYDINPTVPPKEKMHYDVNHTVPPKEKMHYDVNHTLPTKEKMHYDVNHTLPTKEKMHYDVNHTLPPKEKMHYDVNHTLPPKEKMHYDVNHTLPTKEKMHYDVNHTLPTKEKMHYDVNHTVPPKEKMHYDVNHTLPTKEKMHYDVNHTLPPYHYGSPWIESPIPPPDMVTLTPINSAGEFRHGMPILPTSHMVDSPSMSQNYHHDNRVLNNPMHHPAVGKVPPYMLGAYQ
ncbi:unnamed protein product [Meganyctiphanes norvegica]|uniref:C2H2-type domain-containing protein n=1 Tax=Meganyctiphanes norvegica TaxID=48144 RepID=A0AAV2Q5N9_MEGNR